MSARFRRFAWFLPVLLVIVALGLFAVASSFNSTSAPSASITPQLSIAYDASANANLNYSPRQNAPALAPSLQQGASMHESLMGTSNYPVVSGGSVQAQ